MSKNDITDSCWLWAKGLDTGGYGKICVWQDHKCVTFRAHRAVYEALVGPIPEGLELDHLCRVISCVNPDHLEPVTGRENTLRSNSFAAINAHKTHCSNGHPFAGENLYVHRTGRACRTCNRAKLKARRAQKKAVA